MKKSLLLLLSSLFFIVSCETEPQIDEKYRTLDQKAKIKNALKAPSTANLIPPALQDQAEENEILENLRIQFLQEDPASACLPTDLAPLVNKYLGQLMADPVAGQLYDTYIKLNRTLALKDTGKQYFGKHGEYTRLMEKRIRELEGFWNMKGEVMVKGQHVETLNDRHKLAEYYYNLSVDDRSWENAYNMADYFIELNSQSPNLPESPLLAGDGFTNYRKQIIIGDGLVQILSETGIDAEIIWTGILAHEWAHQIQIDHAEPWFDSAPPFLDAPIIELELEADFFAAYFLTHKRGATYNWKNVEQFLDLFFQSGDCAFENPGHHGTPEQRMLASRLGYELADDAQKKGHILSQQEVHKAFRSLLPMILNRDLK